MNGRLWLPPSALLPFPSEFKSIEFRSIAGVKPEWAERTLEELVEEGERLREKIGAVAARWLVGATVLEGLRALPQDKLDEANLCLGEGVVGDGRTPVFLSPDLEPHEWAPVYSARRGGT